MARAKLLAQLKRRKLENMLAVKKLA